MAIYLKPEERIIAFRIDDGPWWFDEGFLKLWVAVGETTEIHDFHSPNASDDNSKKPNKRFFQALRISRNGD